MTPTASPSTSSFGRHLILVLRRLFIIQPSRGGFSLPAPVVTACHPEPVGDSLLPLGVCKCCRGERQLSPLAFPTGDRALLCERQMLIMHCVKKYCLTLFLFFSTVTIACSYNDAKRRVSVNLNYCH